MKKLLLLSTFAFFLFPFAFSQQYGWVDISANMPESANLNDVLFIGEEGWITGWDDGVFYTPDGGETFQIQTLPENSGISSSIFMKNNMDGYVVTFLGNILRTTDGGTTWVTLHEPGGGLNSVHFPPNSDVGYACGSNGTVWSFDDVSISNISPSGVSTNLQSICFPVDSNDGKICGQTTIARYKNNTWVNLQFYDATLNYNSIYFINNNLGWSCGINGTIIRTTNGSHWEFQESNTTIENFNDIFFINSLEGWAVGTEVLSHSVDSGSTWTEELASQTIGVELRAIYFTSANNGYVVGNYTVLKYGEVSGINDSQAFTFDFDVYPNPCWDMLKLQYSSLDTRYSILEIVDYSGKVALKQELGRVGEAQLSVDVSHLPSGLYLVKLQMEDAVGVRKLIIN